MILITLVISQLLVNIWMFYAKAVNCCAELTFILNSGPDGGSCPAPTDCRGFTGNCGDMVAQFAYVPVLPDFPDGLADYVCHAFPDEEAPLDSFIVGLISLAIALPVTMFLQTCFAIANDSEAPESWLEWPFTCRKLVFGFNAHHKWHYTGPKGQPQRHVKWFCRSVGAPPTETAINLVHSFTAWLTCSDPPWVVEAREAEEEAMAEAADDADAAKADGTSCTNGLEAHQEEEAARSESGSTSSSVRSGRALARYKRIVAATGFIGIYMRWGVSYAMGAAAEWKDILQEAVKGAILLAILERLLLTRPANWLEEHIDYYSLQSLLYNQNTVGFYGQIRLFWQHTKRISS